MEIDIAPVREAFTKREISNIAWIRIEDNYADNLTKMNGFGAIRTLLQTHNNNHVIRQRIPENAYKHIQIHVKHQNKTWEH